jgi:hypothetical protein
MLYRIDLFLKVRIRQEKITAIEKQKEKGREN